MEDKDFKKIGKIISHHQDLTNEIDGIENRLKQIEIEKNSVLIQLLELQNEEKELAIELKERYGESVMTPDWIMKNLKKIVAYTDGK